MIADKNTCLCIANRIDRIATIIKQHFGNHNICERMSKEQAQEFMERPSEHSSHRQL